ncbi:MAG: hypothetical protein A2521_05675 [Deltaproteobacteria bacterium RIFOXYD12_FULL_57_12]|nr:MAG: hypothetical protein A2521_05675 [Deltaproteobacteria bacterium RIFOXYD12_FULL_57_12]
MDNDRKITWLTSFSHFITHGYMTLLPAVLVVIAGEQSLSLLHLGIIANVGYFLYGIGSFPAGWLADRFGSKLLLTVGIFGMSIASILVGFSFSMPAFAVAYALLGAFASIHHPAGLALVARRVTVKGKCLGIHGVLGNVGLTTAPLFASLCVLLFGSWRAAYIVCGLGGLLLGMVFQMSRIEGEPDFSLSSLKRLNRPYSASGPVPAAPEPVQPVPLVIPVALLLLFVDSILSGFIFRGSLTFFPALLQREVLFITNHETPVVMAGFVTTAVLSLGVIGSFFGGYLNDKMKTPELLPIIIFTIVTPTLYFLSRLSDFRLLAAGCLFSLVYYAWQPSQNYLIVQHTRRASHGFGFGINFFLIFGIGSIATAVGGYMSDQYGVDRFYGLMAIVSGAALVCSITTMTVRNRQIRLPWRVGRTG